MGDTFVTFHGWVGTDVTQRNAGGVNVVNFRVATTPRIKRKGEWIDGETTWYAVSAWRALADNVNESVRKGDAVVVHGRLRSESWTREDGQSTTTLLVEASMVGHDLCRGTSTFVRAPRPERSDQDVHEQLAEMIAEQSVDSPQLDSWGDPVPPREPFAEAEPGTPRGAGQQPAA